MGWCQRLSENPPLGRADLSSKRASSDLLLPYLLTPDPFDSKVGLTTLSSFRHVRTDPQPAGAPPRPSMPLADWLQGRDSSPRPLSCEPSELPDCSTLR